MFHIFFSGTETILYRNELRSAKMIQWVPLLEWDILYVCVFKSPHIIKSRTICESRGFFSFNLYINIGLRRFTKNACVVFFSIYRKLHRRLEKVNGDEWVTKETILLISVFSWPIENVFNHFQNLRNRRSIIKTYKICK